MKNNIACRECLHRVGHTDEVCLIGYRQFPSSEQAVLSAARNGAEVCFRVIDRYDKRERFWDLRRGVS